jgi:hypothetical protein
MWHVWETGKMHTGLWGGDLRERDHLEHLGISRRIILKWDVGWGGMDWIPVA